MFFLDNLLVSKTKQLIKRNEFITFMKHKILLNLAIMRIFGVHDIHCVPKSYKLKLLGKLVVRHGINVLFGEKSFI